MVLLLGAVPASSDQSAVDGYRALIGQDLRLATVSYRLAFVNAPFCQQKIRNLGWVLHDERQYPDRKLAGQAFGFRQPVSVAATVPRGAADKAGIRTGDGLISINGNALFGTDHFNNRPASERLETVLQQIDRELAGVGPVQIELDTEQGVRRFTLDPPVICASQFWVDVRDQKDAGADGDKVRITSGMMNYIVDDAELAAVVAHEFAHNILGHRLRLAATKRNKSKAVLETEIEADRLSVWLMANAGYDPAKALQFAERYGRDYDLGIFNDGTHLRWRNRVRTLQVEIDLIIKTTPINGLRQPPLLLRK